MTNVLTSPINIPNVSRMRVSAVKVDGDSSIAFVTVQVTMIGGNIYGTYAVQAINGSSIGIRANPSPTGPGDVVQLFTVSTATAFTDISAAFATAGSQAVKFNAVETALIAAGMMPAGTVS